MEPESGNQLRSIKKKKAELVTDAMDHLERAAHTRRTEGLHSVDVTSCCNYQ